MRNSGVISAALLGLALLVAAAHWAGYRATVNQIADRGQGSLTLATERLTLQLDRFRYLPAVLASDDAIKSVLIDPETVPEGNRILQRIADTAGAADIYVMDRTGVTVAASNWDTDHSFVGWSFSWRPYFYQAVTGGLSYHHGVGLVSGRRGYYFAHPIQNDAKEIVGVIAVKIDLERIESQWRGDAQTLFFSDDNGIVILANRTSLVLRALGALPTTGIDNYAGRKLLPMPDVNARTQHGYRTWRDTTLDGVPQSSLVLSRTVPTVGLTAYVLADLSQARVQALLWAGLAAALGGAVFLLAAIIFLRRAALRRLLMTKEAARNELEFKVVERTAELKRAQADLVQAGKMTALGQMSAGISHELNQPLAAIQSLSDNAEILLDRGEVDDVRSNIAKISKITERMARIIRNLRAFARKEPEEIGDVDISAIIADAIGLMHERIDAAGVTLFRPEDTGPVIVRGGPVRLQQVFVNLIANAIDAMAGHSAPEIHICLDADRERVSVSVRDTGAGLSDPARIFDPFYTTKEVGAGLGLGLSISYGIVESFGGSIEGSNHPDGGAVFTLNLAASKQEVQAA